MKKWFVALVALVALAAVIAVTLGVRLAREAEPTLRRELEVWLSARLNSDVQLASLTVELYPRLRVQGTGLVLRLKNRPDLPPFISIERWSGIGEVTTLRAKRLTEVRLEGVAVVVPPGRSADLTDLKKAGTALGTSVGEGETPAPPLIIETLKAESVLLTVMSRNPKRDAQVWDVRDLVMEPFSFDAATPFSATVDTPLPADRARVAGTVGPWPRGDFERLPIMGEYTFAGDFSARAGLAAHVEASGSVLGTLERLATNGTASSAAFGFETKAGGRLPFTAKYEALFDGTNGDLILTRVITNLGSSTFETSGRVLRERGRPGRHVSLAVKTRERAEVADVLRLLVDGEHPPLRGRLVLDGTLDLPPGEAGALERLTVEGTFRLSQVRFANSTAQGKIDDLSRRGQGRPSDVAVRDVPSDIRGHVRLRAARLTLMSVAVALPGATIDGVGSYGLDTEQIRFRGVARLESTLSRTQTGARRIFLRPLDPLFRKQDAGTRLVVNVRGTKTAPLVGMDWGATVRGRR